MAHAFFLGVDVRSTGEDDTHNVTHTLLEKSKDDASTPAQYRLDHIRRHEEVTSADDMADHLQSLVADRPYIGRTTLIVNRRRDAGQAVVEALQNRGLDPVSATITEGSGAAAGETDEIGVQVGGITLVSTLASLYRDGQFTLETHASELASRVARDVQGLAEALDEAEGDGEMEGAESRGPAFDPQATHITSAGLAAWLGTERSFDPSKHLKESPQTDASAFGDEQV